MDDSYLYVDENPSRIGIHQEVYTLEKALQQTGQVSTSEPVKKSKVVQQVLKGASIFCFSSLLVGQWLFFYYIIAFYGFSVINGNLEIWNRFEPLGSTPYVAGDFGGNIAFAAHALGAGIVAFGGVLQLMPQIRRRFPVFHKYNGHVYLTTVLALAISGFYLVLIRGTSPNIQSAIGTSINGLLILSFIYLAYSSIKKRDIRNHRKWAMRLFFVSNAQWCLRVGVFAYMISGTVLGIEPSFGDPFFFMWTFGCFLIPLAILQLYFYANEHKSRKIKYGASLVVCTATIFMLIGVMGLTPFLQQLINGDAISL